MRTNTNLIVLMNLKMEIEILKKQKEDVEKTVLFYIQHPFHLLLAFVSFVKLCIPFDYAFTDKKKQILKL